MTTPAARTEQIREVLVSSISSLVGLPLEEIDASADLATYGIGSTEALAVACDLESFFGYEIPPNIAFEHATINQLVEVLSDPGWRDQLRGSAP